MLEPASVYHLLKSSSGSRDKWCDSFGTLKRDIRYKKLPHATGKVPPPPPRPQKKGPHTSSMQILSRRLSLSLNFFPLQKIYTYPFTHRPPLLSQNPSWPPHFSGLFLSPFNVIFILPSPVCLGSTVCLRLEKINEKANFLAGEKFLYFISHIPTNGGKETKVMCPRSLSSENSKARFELGSFWIQPGCSFLLVTFFFFFFCNSSMCSWSCLCQSLMSDFRDF